MEKVKDLFSFGQKINFRSIKKEFWGWLFIGVGLFLVSRQIDKVVFSFFETYVHGPKLDMIVIFLTERFLYFVLAIFTLVTGWRVWKNPNHHSKLLPGAFAVVTAGIMGVILKQFFGVPRPFFQFPNLDPLVWADLASFPSNHTAVAFALLIPIYRISKILGWAWGLFAIVIGIARVYENVHFPSDIAGGIFLGGVIGAIFSNPNTEMLLRKWWRNLEFRRQSFHFLAGFLCVFAHWIGVLRWRSVLILLIIGLGLSAFSAKRKIPIVSDLLQMFDRKRDYDFPGRGAFYFLFGIFLTILIFPVKIAYASILILAVGDSLNHLFFDRTPRRINIPWNRKKNLIGLGLGITAGTFAAQFFVPLWPAFIATSFALVLETMIVRIGRFYIDDNVFVPLVAGFTLIVLS